MALQVIEAGERKDYGTRKLDERTGVVVIEGDSPDEVVSAEARKEAFNRGTTLGFSRPGLGMASGSYLVDADGVEVTQHSAGCKYRCDYPIQGNIF